MISLCEIEEAAFSSGLIYPMLLQRIDQLEIILPQWAAERISRSAYENALEAYTRSRIRISKLKRASKHGIISDELISREQCRALSLKATKDRLKSQLQD